MEYPLFTDEFEKKLTAHFRFIYGEERVPFCLDEMHRLLKEFERSPADTSITISDVWTHQDHILITYGDMVRARREEAVSCLCKLRQFLNEELHGVISTVHILPFYPSSSDDGFSVVDYVRVDSSLGGWDDIESLSGDYRVMADLVMNHASRHSSWFKNYLKGNEPYKDFFIEVDPTTDVSDVTRPRSTPLLTPVHTENGEKFVWTTFSADQVDVNFANPVLLFRFIKIFLFYLSKGVNMLRLDAVAYIWKELGTNCIHLPETHEIVKLMRTLADHYAPTSTLITETNVPHKENISYFGDGDEAHMVYQFSLPPLLLHAILTEKATYLTQWATTLNDLPPNCTYFNFTSSHDGIGVRPLEGLVPAQEFAELVEGIKKRGGFVSEKQNADGSLSPYELNITYFDAFSEPNGSGRLQEKRYLCSQILMLSFQGVPGIYFHNLTATRNNMHGVRTTGRYRTINRKKWLYDELTDELNDPDTTTHRIFYRYKEILTTRKKHPAFHPFGSQRVMNIDDEIFCMERQSPDGRETILVLANVSGASQKRSLSDGELPILADRAYVDLLSNSECIQNGQLVLDPYQVAWVLV
ncbi:MAG: alpha-amylase family glycosyl hydrolase [Balneolaceae bacterium]